MRAMWASTTSTGDTSRRRISSASRQAGAWSSKPTHHLAGGAFARFERALEIAGPLGGGLGAGEVDAPDRLAQGRAGRGERARRGDRDRAPASPRLGGPVDGGERARAPRLV